MPDGYKMNVPEMPGCHLLSAQGTTLQLLQ